MTEHAPMRITIGQFTFVQALKDKSPARCEKTGKPVFAIPGGGLATEAEIRRALTRRWDGMKANHQET